MIDACELVEIGDLQHVWSRCIYHR
jgi:hypothetical protein